MKAFIVSLATGVLAGGLYSLLQVQSPAPPLIALLGLLGMLIGEQVVPLLRRLLKGERVSLAWFRHECVPAITGAPGAARPVKPVAGDDT